MALASNLSSSKLESHRDGNTYNIVRREKEMARAKVPAAVLTLGGECSDHFIPEGNCGTAVKACEARTGGLDLTVLLGSWK